MKLDIQSTLEKATEIDNICIDMRGIEALYVARLANGKDYSAKFDEKALSEFVPSRTVSEMLQSWEESIKRRHAEAIEAIKTGLHPTRTFERDIMATTPQGYEYKTGETETVRSKIDRYERGQFKFLAKQLEEQFGKLTFVKIVPKKTKEYLVIQ